MWASIVEGFGFPVFVATRILTSLLLTVAVELSVAIMLGLRTRRDLAAVVWINVLTNPPLVLALVALDAGLLYRDATVFWPAALALEALVALLEWPLLRWATARPWRKTLQVSIAMNAASLVVGLFFWSALWWLALLAINSAWTPSG